MQLLLSIALPLILIIYLIQKRRNPKNTLAPPGPRGLPFIGNLHQFAATTDQHVYLWKLSRKHGPVMQMKLGSVPLLVVSSAESAREVLKSQDLAFCSRPKLLGQQRLSYNASDMVFAPYGDYWKEVRKITSIHLFSIRKTQSFRPIREDEVSRMLAKIRASGSEQPEARVVNLSAVAMALSSTLICRVAFGKIYDEHGAEMRRFDRFSREAQELMATFYVSDYFPSFGWIDKLTGLMDRLEKVFWDLDSFYEELIEEHRNRRERAAEEDEDVLGVLIKALLMNIFIAATDTTTVSIVWTMTALMKAPTVMKKVQAEIRNLIGENGKLDEGDLPNLPYLKAVIKETLRLYPPAPLLVPRQTIEKCTLEGYEIQPNTVVFVNAWAVARDPKYWENPDEFMPERFLNSNIHDITGQDFGAIPFGSGRRICPGMSMGLANMELTVASLLYNFDWEMPEGIKAQDIDTDTVPGITMHKKNPLILVARDYVA
ncbi:6,7,8-trihydroxycoumarin synthase-like isoform X2 [Salvia miltiorrhiza]|uniref:6,7,8-trihydroxycoumarin synthase-like isoform X2 n=1 Tax=Salvia miltiorrhiza TaxID=226208 RepID=UPI0025AC1888|nr:6,7,8-trihydroxycoumarin synthase-like isoform X2 [Salvia miltiorrhiza]